MNASPLDMVTTPELLEELRRRSRGGRARALALAYNGEHGVEYVMGGSVIELVGLSCMLSNRVADHQVSIEENDHHDGQQDWRDHA